MKLLSCTCSKHREDSCTATQQKTAVSSHVNMSKHTVCPKYIMRLCCWWWSREIREKVWHSIPLLKHSEEFVVSSSLWKSLVLKKTLSIPFMKRYSPWNLLLAHIFSEKKRPPDAHLTSWFAQDVWGSFGCLLSWNKLKNTAIEQAAINLSGWWYVCGSKVGFIQGSCCTVFIWLPWWHIDRKKLSNCILQIAGIA